MIHLRSTRYDGHERKQGGYMLPTIFISAGEASGEHYGALLIAALQQKLKNSAQTASFFGMGGERMRSVGLECVVRAEDMAVMGFTEVVRHLPRIYGEFRKLKKAIRARRPAVAVLIDFPGFHFKLAEALHREGIPVIYFVSPQLWAWKKKRIRLVQKYIDKMLVIFPFEEAFYREHGVQAEFVGHPLAELPLPSVGREEFAAANGLDPAKTWIGLLPGSRPKEIRDHLPAMLRAARKLTSCFNGSGDGNADPSTPPDAKSASGSAQDDRFIDDRVIFEFLIPLAPTLNAKQREVVRQIVAEDGNGLGVRLVNDARAALMHARASVVASGTATVEAALIGNPFVVVYRVSALTYAIAKRVVKVPHVAMANLIAGKRVVPELIQSDFTAENIVQQIAPLVADGSERKSMIEELQRVQGVLAKQTAGGAIERVAEVTLEMMGFVNGFVTGHDFNRAAKATDKVGL
ncbi:MAG: lipid-A-disaccharide synthase [Terracidiphilus sp.]